MSKFKLGDVVTYIRDGRVRVGIVMNDRDAHWEYEADALAGRWHAVDGPAAIPRHGHVTLHPDPDPIIVSFTAWKLTR